MPVLEIDLPCKSAEIHLSLARSLLLLLVFPASVFTSSTVDHSRWHDGNHVLRQQADSAFTNDKEAGFELRFDDTSDGKLPFENQRKDMTGKFAKHDKYPRLEWKKFFFEKTMDKKLQHNRSKLKVTYCIELDGAFQRYYMYNFQIRFKFFKLQYWKLYMWHKPMWSDPVVLWSSLVFSVAGSGESLGLEYGFRVWSKGFKG